MAAVTVLGPGGAPMRPPYGSFAGKPASGGRSGNFTVMGPAGAPMRPPWASFAGKPASSGAAVIPHNLHFFSQMGALKSF